jgi:hypothetical protein
LNRQREHHISDEGYLPSMRRIDQCFNVKLQEICQQAKRLDELNFKIRQYLPELLRTQCQVGSFAQGCLILTTTDPVWASHLRYYIPELRDRLRKDGGLYELSSIKIKLATAGILPEKPVQENTLSQKARLSILKEAQFCNDSPLKAALYKLAKHTPKDTGSMR